MVQRRILDRAENPLSKPVRDATNDGHLDDSRHLHGHTLSHRSHPHEPSRPRGEEPEHSHVRLLLVGVCMRTRVPESTGPQDPSPR